MDELLINPAVRGRAEQIHRDFANAKPFRYAIVDNFLEEGFCRELMAQFPGFDARKAVNEYGETGRKAVHPQLARLGPAYKRFDQLIRNGEFLAFMSRITGVPQLLYDPEYVGGGTHENLHGQDLDPHVDFNYHPNRHWHRRLNLIVFLNPEWEESWGGCLQFHRNPWAADGEQAAATVVPLANRAVVFETNEYSWHGFRRIDLPAEKRSISRKSVAVYLYTKDRPAEEVASSHSTVYVPRHLSQHIQAGHMLSPEDATEIRDLLARRDAQLKYLYEREQELWGALQGVFRSPSLRIGRAITWPARALRDWAQSRK